MSGFVGWVDFQSDLRTEQDTFQSMLKTMRNRGPDGEGSWISSRAAMGHRRLSINDLDGSPLPVLAETERGTVVLAFVGEIYNFRELGREIEGAIGSFRKDSDAEVLLQCFLYWGSQFFERLNGMFAFAIWDERERRLLLGRDHLGIKPLYYFQYAGGLLFASEPKGIMANPLFKARLDFSAMPILLQPRLALPGETPLAGLREVPPAHTVSYSQAGLALRRFWRLSSAPHDDSFDESAARVRALVQDAVSRQLATDISFDAIGEMLSGGLDSTCVAALMIRSLQTTKDRKRLDTFCIQYENDSAHFVPTELRPEVDAPYAAIAAKFIGSRHRTITAGLQDLLEVIPETRRARDLPGWGQFDASMYLLFRHMRSTCSVALTGEIADELFGGYPYCFFAAAIGRDTFPWLGDGPKLSDYLSPELLTRIDPREDERTRYSYLLSEVPRLPGEDAHNARMREVLYLGMAGPLSVLLERMDRMSAALGLEMRLPFCDHRLVEYVWNVPWSLKSQGGVKGLLKAAMSDILPSAVMERRKSAYPHIKNPEYERMLIQEAARIVNDKHSAVAWMFDGARLNSLINQIALGTANLRSLPGGVSGAFLLIQLIEMSKWIDDYKVSL